ncbi:MAG: hypothetical protein ACT4OZ_13750 [Gemmatimonadota bacterium]
MSPAQPSATAGITIRELSTPAEYEECCRLQEETWGAGFNERVPGAILRVAQKMGGVAAGAFDARDRLVGFVFGITGIRHGALAHWSDMLAVRTEARGANLGERLKHYQRDRMLALGVSTMYWTYDPLVARNAHLNINRLGAMPAEYVPDMYGSNTGSTLHGNVPTDRLVVRWDLTREHTPHSGPALPEDGSIPLVNAAGDDGLPHVAAPEGSTARIAIPRQPPEMGGESEIALTWRLAVRASFQSLEGRGFTVTRFVREPAGTASLPYYVLEVG